MIAVALILYSAEIDMAHRGKQTTPEVDKFVEKMIRSVPDHVIVFYTL